MKPCMVDGCDKPRVALERCRTHYWKMRRERLAFSGCTVPGCVKVQFCGTLCRGHYARKLRGVELSTPLRASAGPGVSLTCRVSTDAAALLTGHARAAGITPEQMASRLIMRTLGLPET